MESEIIETEIIESELEFTAQASSVPEIISNYIFFKERLVLEVSKYKIKVTEDTVTKAKKMMASLNKIKKSIKDKEKEVKAFFNKPMEGFGDKIEELENICDTSREEISKQVDIFENETKAECLKLVIKLIADLRGDYKIRNEFFASEYQDLIKLTAITAKGGLTKATKEAIDYRIKKEQMNQMLHDGRIDENFKECTNAGIEPFTKASIAHLLFLDQDQFKSKLKSMIDAELDRNKKIKEKATADATALLRQKVQDEEREKIRKEEQAKIVQEKPKEIVKEVPIAVKIESPKIEDKPLVKVVENKERQWGEPKFKAVEEEKPKEGIRRIYPSSMPRIFKCPNSRHTPEMNIREDFSGTNEGKAVHKFNERWLRESTDIKLIIGEVEDFFKVDVAYMCWNLVKLLTKYRPFLTKVETEYKIQEYISSGLVSGYIDTLGWADPTKAVIIDVKGGFNHDRYEEQLKTYGLALFKRFPELQKVAMVTVYAMDSKIVTFSMLRDGSIEFEKEIETIFSKDQYTVGDACKYCPLRNECPARKAVVANTIQTITGAPLSFADPELHSRVALAKQAIAKFDELFYQQVETQGELRIGLDTYFISRNNKEEIKLTAESMEYLKSVIGDDLLKSLSISESKLKDVVMDKAPSGLKIAEWRAFFEEFSKKGFTETVVKERLSKK